MSGLVSACVSIAAFCAFMGAMMFAIEGDDWIPGLGTEGRIVLGIIAGALWPIVALILVVLLVQAAWRGVVQCVRLVFPEKANLPKARVV